jgi:MoaA/NifB/PqqE/SkfB family radical SAM enzyme
MEITRRADVKLGFACNNRCLFCAQGDRRDACGAVPFEEVLARLVTARSGSRSLVLTGGEPTLHRRIVAIVQAAAQLGFRPIQLQTNGRMLAYRQVLDALMRAGLTEVSPSLHASTADVHDALTRRPGSWEESREGIRNAVDAGLPVVTNSVITRQNAHDLPALVTRLASLGVRQAQLAFVHPVGTAAQEFDAVVPRLSDVVAPLTEARRVAREAGVRLVTEAIPYCFLRGMDELAVEASIPETTVVEMRGEVFDYSQWRVAEGKAHGEPCTRCAERPRCEGPWREYPARFGWDEFVPVAALHRAPLMTSET